MTVTRAVARPMLAGMFVYGGVDALRHPESKVSRAEDVAPAIAKPLGLPTDTVTLVRINAGVQVAGGLLLATGRLPRVASLALAGSLLPTTYAGHQFWNETDETLRHQQTVHFLKNVSMLGGLLLAAVDTEGRPSLSWRARRLVRRGQRARRRAQRAGGPIEAVVTMAHEAAGHPLEAGHALAMEASRLSRSAAAASERAGTAAAGAGKRVGEAAERAGRATRRAAKRAARDAALAAAAVGAAKSTTRAKAVAARAAETATDHAREGAHRARAALQDVTLDSTRAAAKIVHDARQALPLAG
jgi:uncharacterized membrane protein YphA (DoxX/SURF4 family)